MADVKITVKPGVAVITPFAIGVMADDSYKAAVEFSSEKNGVPRLNYYLHCVAMELTFKAAILSKDCTEDKKKFLRRKIGHDLDVALEVCDSCFDLSFLNEEDRNVISSLNPFFKGKALEYFTGYMMHSVLTGSKDLPKIEDTRIVSGKINKFLNENNLFKNGKTSYEPSGGIIHFI